MAVSIWSRPLFMVKVEGESLWPHLVPGRRYFATSLLRPKVGRLVIFKSPAGETVFYVKKVVSFENGLYHVSGSVPWSSSYQVAPTAVLGIIISTRFSC